MYQILENLYQGGYCKNIPSEVTAIMCLVERPLYPDNWEKLNWHIWRPLVDGVIIDPIWLNETTSILKSMLEKNIVYVHCAAGISRSATIVAHYLMKENNWNYDKSLNFLASKNPTIDPAPRFMEVLKSI
jgi:protein tyrosine phosphatase